MNLVLTVAEVTAPVFLLAAIGFAWVKSGWDYPVAFVTRLAMTLAMPALIFSALMLSPADPRTLGDLALAAFAAYALAGLAFLGLAAVAGLDRRTYVAPLAMGNTGNLGLPLALFAFGETGLAFAVVVFAAMSVLGFTLGMALVAGRGSLLTLAREPVVWATAAGALFLWQGWQTPPVLTRAIELLGQMMIPLMLITLGVAIAGLRPGRLWQALGLAVLKLAVCLPIGWAAARLFGLEADAQAVLLLQIATPVAVTSYLIARRFGADADAVAGLVVVSTALSVGFLPVLLALLL